MSFDPLSSPGLFARSLRPTFFSERINARSWEGWNGFRVPLACVDPEVEAMALSVGCGLTDLTPLCVVRIQGTGAPSVVDRLTTLRVGTMAEATVRTTLLCDGAGRVLAIADVQRLGLEDFVLVSEMPVLAWIEDGAKGFSVTVTSETAAMGILGLFGPGIDQALAACRFGPPSAEGAGTLWPVARQGLMGRVVRHADPGGPFGIQQRAEIWVEPGDAQALVEFFAREAGVHALPVGVGALEMTRVLSGWPRLGRDAISPDYALDPADALDAYDLGLEALIDWDKLGFSGRDALMTRRDNGDAGRRLFHVTLSGAAQPGQLLRRGEARAELTSVAQCPVTHVWSGLARTVQTEAVQGPPWILDNGRADGPAARGDRAARVLMR